jgi:cardiolipin synthase
MPVNLPNLLTWLRILLIPLFLAIYYLPDAWLTAPHKNLTATALFAFAAITDWLDGYLARSLNQTSAFGAFLDPVADKLMVAAALILLREWMAKLGQSRNVAVHFLGKLKTACQMTAILLLLYHGYLLGIDTDAVGTVLIYVAALLTLWSMGYYLRRAMPWILEKAGGPSP